ncbi:MAG TPA: hypothetical protein VGX68_08175 [Thermoanaerobaculia bacterium]|jgi:hypothetical protein|nr:hypothetical protein [Thermoanaerobaculia bacterium]
MEGKRLEPDKLRVWLDKYMLGELWRMGEIGTNRTASNPLVDHRMR